jgi:PIN domain nuclease of toxin-antitoxin system
MLFSGGLLITLNFSSRAREVIADPQNIIFFSIASAWEIIIKAKLGKLPLPESPESHIPSRIRHYDFQVLTIKMNHVLQIWELENHQYRFRLHH